MTLEQSIEADFARARHLIKVIESGYPIDVTWMRHQINDIVADSNLRRVEFALFDRTVRALEEMFAQYVRKHPKGDDQADVDFALGVEP